jgi:hypothetical protein
MCVTRQGRAATAGVLAAESAAGTPPELLCELLGVGRTARYGRHRQGSGYAKFKLAEQPIILRKLTPSPVVWSP